MPRGNPRNYPLSKIESARFWYGTLPFPPYQNNAIMPVMRRRNTGKMGAAIINTKESAFYYAQATKHLQEQWEGLHDLFYEGDIGVCLTLYPPHNRGDIDGPVKKALDALQMGKIIANDRMIKTLFVVSVGVSPEPYVAVRIWGIRRISDGPEIDHIIDICADAI